MILLYPQSISRGNACIKYIVQIILESSPIFSPLQGMYINLGISIAFLLFFSLPHGVTVELLFLSKFKLTEIDNHFFLYIFLHIRLASIRFFFIWNYWILNLKFQNNLALISVELTFFFQKLKVYEAELLFLLYFSLTLSLLLLLLIIFLYTKYFILIFS